MGDGYISIKDRKQHPTLWLDDGNTVLATKVSRFRVHRTRLAMDSPVFAHMLSKPRSHTDSTGIENAFEGLPVFEIPDSDVDFTHLLCFIYDHRYYQIDTITTFEKISGLLRMSTRYQMDDLRNEIISHLGLAYPSTVEKYLEIVGRQTELPLFPPFHGQHFAVVALARETKASKLLPAALWRSMCMTSRDIVDGAVDSNGTRYKLSATDIQRCILQRSHIYETVIQSEIALTNSLNETDCLQVQPTHRVISGLQIPCRQKARLKVIHHFSDSGPEIREDHDMLIQMNAFEAWRHLVCSGCRKVAESELSRLRTSLWNTLPRVLIKMDSSTGSDLVPKCKVWAATCMFQVVRFAMHSLVDISSSMDSSNTRLPIEDRKKHPTLWLDDGNIVLATNLSRFRVHRTMLSMGSPVFADMLSMPVPLWNTVGTENTFEGLPVVEIPDNDVDFTHLLCFLYDSRYYQGGSFTTFEKISGLLRLSNKYQMDVLRDETISHLSLAYPKTLEKYLEAVDKKTQMPLFPPFPGQHFAIVALARETDASTLLPAALWRSMCMTSRDIQQGAVDSNGTRHRLSSTDVLQCIVKKSQVYKTLVRVEYSLAMAILLKRSECVRQRQPSESSCSEIAVFKVFHRFSVARSGWNIRDDDDLLTHLDAFDVWRPLVCDNCGKVADSRLSQLRVQEWNILPKLFGLPEWNS
ncbi:hypothetical protein BD410DRAFT_776893 [Rickenella mellea]|uniref:BTB domain-containing protein n=1 Tax=Rickenella mellea TaxID=50990 RepID=A0A4Y7PML9_9AGAM|nr:hypothetical protein BD410DRAFT_776893 [Rickenella mellea]